VSSRQAIKRTRWLLLIFGISPVFVAHTCRDKPLNPTKSLQLAIISKQTKSFSLNQLFVESELL